MSLAMKMLIWKVQTGILLRVIAFAIVTPMVMVTIWPVLALADVPSILAPKQVPVDIVSSAITTTIFPFGYYGLEEPVENPGFSPRVYIDSAMKPDSIGLVLNIAQAGGVQVYQYLPPGALSLPLPTLRDQWLIPAATYSPSIMAGFYPSEEPSISEIPAMIDLLNLAHETDPHHRPVLTYLGYFNISNIKTFRDTVDIDLIGAYPLFKGYPQGLMTGAMDSARQALWPVGKRFYAVPETFGPILTHPNGPLLLRNNVYQGVIGGAEGIIFYESSGFDGTTYPAFRAELDQLHDEFVGSGQLGAVVLSPDPPQVVTYTVLAGPTSLIQLDQFEYIRYYDRLQYKLKVYQNEAYLLVTNIAADPLSIQFHNFPSSAGTVTVLFENRILPLTADSFQDTFAPFDVHVYWTENYTPPLGPPVTFYFLPLIFKRAGP